MTCVVGSEFSEGSPVSFKGESNITGVKVTLNGSCVVSFLFVISEFPEGSESDEIVIVSMFPSGCEDMDLDACIPRTSPSMLSVEEPLLVVPPSLEPIVTRSDGLL